MVATQCFRAFLCEDFPWEGASYLMADYSVVVPDADTASVKMTETMLTQLTNLVSQGESTLEERTTGFVVDIETSINELRTKASELKVESEDKALYDGWRARRCGRSAAAGSRTGPRRSTR